jgi:hypothetical protein
MGIVLRDLGDDAVVTGGIALFPITSSTAVMGQGGATPRLSQLMGRKHQHLLHLMKSKLTRFLCGTNRADFRLMPAVYGDIGPVAFVLFQRPMTYCRIIAL